MELAFSSPRGGLAGDVARVVEAGRNVRPAVGRCRSRPSVVLYRADQFRQGLQALARQVRACRDQRLCLRRSPSAFAPPNHLRVLCVCVCSFTRFMH